MRAISTRVTRSGRARTLAYRYQPVLERRGERDMAEHVRSCYLGLADARKRHRGIHPFGANGPATGRDGQWCGEAPALRRHRPGIRFETCHPVACTILRLL